MECLIKEIELQKRYLGKEKISSVYFGGGTPSVVEAAGLSKILDKLLSVFNFSSSTEITLEANPDDLSFVYLKDLKNIGVNRLSIGIQSFVDDHLVWMNRRHNSKQSLLSIENSINAGFDNINIDLIYGLPGMQNSEWDENLRIAFSNKINHLSAYHLTLENKTVYSYRVSKGIMEKPDDYHGIEQYEMLMEFAESKGFIQYEISNFCLPGSYSVHNTSYWQQKPYLGIGPSANSYNGSSRQWNHRNNSLYIKKINERIIPCEIEKLSLNQKYNEYILTSLRTMWGVSEDLINARFGKKYLEYFIRESEKLIKNGRLEKVNDIVRLSGKGKFFADGIISELFWVD